MIPLLRHLAASVSDDVLAKGIRTLSDRDLAILARAAFDEAEPEPEPEPKPAPKPPEPLPRNTRKKAPKPREGTPAAKRRARVLEAVKAAGEAGAQAVALAAELSISKSTLHADLRALRDQGAANTDRHPNDPAVRWVAT